MTKTAGAPQQPQRDVWLYDAICRIFLGRWEQIPTKEGLLQLNQTESQAIYEIMERIRQFSFDDQLHIWGKRQGYETLWEKPPSDFWKHNKIEYESFLDADPKKLQAIPIATSGQVVSLRDLMTSRSTIDALYSSHFSIQAIWIRMQSLVAGAWTKVEPSYVIILGLVIAAAGIAWQLYRGAPLPAHVAQIIAPFQAQIDTLKKQVDKPFFNSGPTPAPPPAPALPKRHTAYEKERRLSAVDEIYNVIATQLQPAYSEGRKTVYDVYRAVDDNAEQHLTEYANKVQAAFDNLNAILKKYSYFPDIVQAATKNTFNDVAATQGVKSLVPELQALRAKAKVPNDIQWFLLRDTTMLDAINQINSFEVYLKETPPRLQETRTEIEKAGVYSAQ
jgi:hypothetical protein